MEVIAMQSEAYQELSDELKKMRKHLEKISNQGKEADYVLSVDDACKLLKISKRTLQKYRDEGLLSFSKVQGRIFFKISDIKAMLEKHYIKSYK